MGDKKQKPELIIAAVAAEFAEAVPTWRYREDWWHHVGGVKVEQEPEGIHAEVFQFLLERYGIEEADPRNVSLVVSALKKCTFLSGVLNPPFWPGAAGPKDVLVTDGGLLDFSPLFSSGEVRLLPHDPRYFAVGKADYAYDPAAECPTWLEFQRWQWSSNEELSSYVEEWMAYCILQSLSLQQFLFVVGNGANGKSVLASVFDGVLGRSNCSHVPLEEIGKRFTLHSTIGRLANLVVDAEETDKMIESKLKQFVGGDPMFLDRKYRRALDAVVATARIIAFGNAVASFRDHSGAIMRRLRIAPVFVSVVGKPDRKLAEKLHAERAGILNRVIRAAKRLVDRGEFAVPAACAKAEQEFWLDNDPGRSWFSEYTCLSPGHFESMDLLHANYLIKMEEWGVRFPLWRGHFGRALNQFYAAAIANGDVRAKRACKEWIASNSSEYSEIARPRGYEGIELLSSPYCNEPNAEVPF